MRRVTSLAAGTAVLIGTTASADTLFVNLAGYESHGFFGNAANTHITVPLLAGSQITNIEFMQLTFQAEALSYTSDFVVSVNDSSAAINFWDSDVPGSGGAPGIVGPVTASFDNPGQFASGPFTMTTNDLYIEVYDLFEDNGAAREAVVLSGGIQITYTPVPAPGALAAFALAGLIGRRRRRS